MTLVFLILPFLIQMVVINLDEFCFHIKRGLPKWERIGHPLDTFTVLLCFGFLLFFPYSSANLKIYIGMSVFSCLFVTKDEFVHKEHCPASEQWLHALLFLNHPVVLATAGLLWPILNAETPFIWMQNLLPFKELIYDFLFLQTTLIMLFFFYQIIYWNFVWKEKLPL